MKRATGTEPRPVSLPEKSIPAFRSPLEAVEAAAGVGAEAAEEEVVAGATVSAEVTQDQRPKAEHRGRPKTNHRLRRTIQPLASSHLSKGFSGQFSFCLRPCHSDKGRIYRFIAS